MKIAAQQGKTFAMLMNTPTLTEHENFFFESFWDLDRSRPNTGMGVSPLPITDILAYCELRLLRSPTDRLSFLSCIHAMDRAYIEHYLEKAKNG